MEDILLLAVFLGTPVLMVLALLWVAARAIRARMAYGSALGSGWTAGSGSGGGGGGPATVSRSF